MLTRCVKCRAIRLRVIPKAHEIIEGTFLSFSEQHHKSSVYALYERKA